jgi:long-subunit fatty acid transport protein
MKQIFTLIIILFANQLSAQEPADALRYSWYTSSGTARQQAIGGAMTSLGGEISATFVNPAGLGFYKTGDIVITPGFHYLNNNSTYYGRMEKDKKNGFAFGTTGIVLGAGLNNKTKKNGIRGAALSLAINQTANFGSNILYRGINSQNSYSQKFLEEIGNDRDANSVANNYPFGASLAFNTYWIDTIAGGSSGNFQFQTRAPIAAGLIQENKVINKGGITELGIAGAVNYNDKFFLGGTLGIPFLHYVKEAKFTEADLTGNTTNKFDFASITENLETDGVGINLKAGLIYKPTEQIRLGLAVHSPTWYSLTDKYNASVSTNTETYKGHLTQNSALFTNGNDAEFKYALLTPYRIMASASYVLREIEDVRKQKGFLTAEIEYVNYKASSFKTDPEGDNSQSTKDYLRSLNRAIDNSYKGAFNFKAGGELKFTTIMARLGAAYYGNPYKSLNGAKGNKFQLTGGLGYRNKGIFIDLAYVHTMGKDVHFPYRLQSGDFSGASIKQTGGNVLLTVGFKI